MNSADDILDATKLCYDGDFDTQVENLFRRVRLTASEVHKLRYVFLDLEQVLQTMAPGSQVLPFGSIVTGLGIKTSDVDCHVVMPNGPPKGNYVIHARNILRTYHKKFTNLFAIANARVPIVKFYHIPTNCNADVNFTTPTGVHNSQLLAFLLHYENKRVLSLAILLKYWSKVHKITGTNLLASYALTVMVIFYLQLMNILPSVQQLQQNVPPYLIENWNYAFDKTLETDIDNSDSLYDLLGGFFKCYASLNFAEHVISPYMGRLLNKNLFKQLDEVPSEFSFYKTNVQENLCKPLKLDTPICIQDPFDHSRNVSAGVYQKLALRFHSLCQFAAKKFDDLPAEHFLKAILTEVDDVSNNVSYVSRPKHTFTRNKVTKHNPNQRRRLNTQFNKYFEQINKIKKGQI